MLCNATSLISECMTSSFRVLTTGLGGVDMNGVQSRKVKPRRGDKIRLDNFVHICEYILSSVRQGRSNAF